MSRARGLLAVAATALAVAALGAPGAAASNDGAGGSQKRFAECSSTFQVLHNDRIGALKLRAGQYRIDLTNPRRITCARASKLFAKFLNDFDGKLPGTWRLNVRKAKFVKSKGFGFRVTRVSGGDGQGGSHPSSSNFDKCPTFRVLGDDRIDGVRFRKGTYAMTAYGGLSCTKASSLFRRFLDQDFDRSLPGSWRLDGKTGTFTRGSSGLSFQVNFRR